MVEPAPANADNAGVPAQRDQADRAAVGALPRTIGVLEAAEITGLSVSTVQRRVDAWRAGDRTDYALKGGTAGSTRGKAATRYVDRADALALAKQLVGDLPPGRHILDGDTP